MKRYKVTLTTEERCELRDLIAAGKAAAKKLAHARILLKADASPGGPAWTDQRIAEAVEVGGATVERVRQRFVEEGLAAALVRKKQDRPSREPQARWPGRGSPDRLGLLRSASGPPAMDATAFGRPVGRVGGGGRRLRRDGAARPQKNEIKPWLKEQWCIPPEADAEFVCAMEDVLEVYHRPYDERRPLVCLDEASKQLIGETVQPLPAEPGQAERFDYEYVRNGTANLFMISEPLLGWRHVEVTQRRTAKDFAEVLRWLVEDLHPDADKVVLVMDNLNTHKLASLYEAFPPDQARRIAERLEIHHTPKHGSWLNVAEIELSVLARQCLDRRIGAAETLVCEVGAWEEARNEQAIGVHWRFTTADARIKLRRLYPSPL